MLKLDLLWGYIISPKFMSKRRKEIMCFLFVLKKFICAKMQLVGIL